MDLEANYLLLAFAATRLYHAGVDEQRMRENWAQIKCNTKLKANNTNVEKKRGRDNSREERQRWRQQNSKVFERSVKYDCKCSCQ